MPAYHARVAFEAHHTTRNNLVVNVLHLEVDTLTSPPDWATIAGDVYTWLGTLWNNVLSTTTTFDQIVVTDENYPGSTHGQGVHVVNTVGARTIGDDKLDPAICAVGSLKTAVVKRYARGHIFLPPALNSAALAATGIFNGADAYWSSCVAFVNAFVGGHTAGSTSYAPEVFSRHQVATGQTPFTFPIVGFSMNSKQKFLRSRSTAP